MAYEGAPKQVDFTEMARETFYGAVDDPYFRDKDLYLIYDALKHQLRLVPFCDYLKRYIYNRAEMTGDYREIPLNEYQGIVVSSFRERCTPGSFTPTTARLPALVRNWLTQQTVNRSVVLLLGFGLAMSVGDVNDFLTKALRERVLNPKDPLEVICWYCFKNHYGYPAYERLWAAFLALPEEEPPLDDLLDEQTSNVRQRLQDMDSEEELLLYLQRLRRPVQGMRQSVVARKAFDRLYARARETAAALRNEAETADEAAQIQRLREQLSENSRLTEQEKAARIRRLRENRPRVLPEDITPGDIERILCSAVPMGRQGNLMPAKASELSKQFSGKRFSRQHIAEVLAERAEIDRFDLITLSFFIYAGDPGSHDHVQRRYSSYIEFTNRILDRCGMGKLYIANPYECFILMCLLSEDPLGTYADVWEISYQSAAKN